MVSINVIKVVACNNLVIFSVYDVFVFLDLSLNYSIIKRANLYDTSAQSELPKLFERYGCR